MMYTNTTMNVVLEASTIGLGSSENDKGKNKTGIFRVTDELANELLKINDIKFYLSFFAYPHGARWGLDYYKSRFDIENIHRRIPFEENVYDIISDLKIIPNRQSFMRIASILFSIFRIKKIPSKIDIFHSLYYPIPKFIDAKKTIRFRTFHDLAPLLFPKFFKHSHRKKFLKGLKNIDFKNDWFFAVSKNTKIDICKHLKIPENHIFVTHLAANSKKFTVINDEKLINCTIKKLNIPNAPYFLSIATLEPRKNLEFTFQSFKNFIKMSKSFKDINLVIIGRKGWLIEGLIADIQSDSILKNRIILTGFVEDEMLAPIINGSIGFLYPSLYEGFGLPALEAMQCGTPVITSNSSSLPEVVGTAGILIDPKNQNEMADAMRCLYVEKRTRDYFSKEGLKRAKKFSWEKCAIETRNGYRKAIERR